MLRDVTEALRDDQAAQAAQVARLYYHQGLTTEAIAQELRLSRPKVSRLLTYARRSGLVEIRIHDPHSAPQSLEAQLRARYPFLTPHVVPVPPHSPEAVWLERVAVAAARLLDQTLRPGQVLGLAWGTTLDAVSRMLTPRPLAGLQVVQLNGSASALDFTDGFVTDTMTRFAGAYGARAHLFPVPTFFDDPATRAAMWRERSVGQVLALQARADVRLYSVGSAHAQVPSHVYAAGYLSGADQQALLAQGVAGDIATVFFRTDGTWTGLPINARSSGPDLGTLRAGHSVCVVSGLGKVRALRAALAGGLMTTLVVDDRTAHALLQEG
ncbi:sugar-binding transcriptional regulator [Deinococcus sp. HMF7620]|uniref:Sugar-binding transcriptional regulator n=1 Tax=Deinococcus arboris TaxID=2682977 RepID=A0A7C9M7U0_9DEIO|nr:sugar-binding transcriptional regulator [Deinococcus arboris]MVN86399.1 sugar-binding transcriptional regulator [Deinococcus arboris]